MLLACLLGAALAAPPISAQGEGWSQPFALSDQARTTSKVSWFPDLAIGPDGSVHVVWCTFPQLVRDNGETAYLDSLMYRVLQNGRWSKSNDIFSAERQGEDREYTVRSSLTFGLDGKLHLLLRDRVAIKYTDAPWTAAWSANSWSSVRGIGEGYYAALATDSKGALHALRTDPQRDLPSAPEDDCRHCAQLFYARSSDSGKLWSTSNNLSEGLSGANRPQIKIDARDRIHVVWDHGFDWYSGNGLPKTGVYRRSDDGGQTWTAPFEFSLPNDAVQQTSLALTNDGNPVVVFRSVKGGKVYMQQSRSGGDGWSAAAEIPGVLALDTQGKGLDRYSLATDGSNHIHLVLSGYKTGERPELDTPALMHLSWDGTDWSPPEEIMRRTGLAPQWPTIAIGGGNRLHVVWYTRNARPTATASEDMRDYRVWYSGKAIDAAAVDQPPLFTPTPQLEPTATPTIEPTVTPTPLAALVLAAPPIDARPKGEVQGLRTIGTTLLVALSFLVSVWLLVRWRATRHT